MSFDWSTQTTLPKAPAKPVKKEGKQEKKEMSLLDFDDCKSALCLVCVCVCVCSDLRWFSPCKRVSWELLVYWFEQGKRIGKEMCCNHADDT